MRVPRFLQVISAETPTDIARAQISAWQRSKEFELLEEIGDVIKRHEARGLERRRAHRVIVAFGNVLSKVGAA